MTQWVENPTGGRDRGPVGIARAWVEVLVRPRRFFENGVAPGDQAPGLIFGIVVVLAQQVLGLALGAPLYPYPTIAESPALGTVLWLLVAVLLVAPIALHLAAALQTVILLVVDRVVAAIGLGDGERGGVSETVQVLAYASAPCVFMAVEFPAVRALAGLYAMGLFVLGTMVVHGKSPRYALLLTLVPASLVFGVGFRTFDAIGSLLRRWYII